MFKHKRGEEADQDQENLSTDPAFRAERSSDGVTALPGQCGNVFGMPLAAVGPISPQTHLSCRLMLGSCVRVMRLCDRPGPRAFTDLLRV